MKINLISAIALFSIAFSPAAFATNVPAPGVPANAVIYYPGDSVSAGNVGGVAPIGISVTGATSITFSVSGMITLNGGTLNDADGVGAATASSSNTGTSSYGGISAPDAGYLTGLFTDPADTTRGANTVYTASSETALSFSPTMNQVFFIGDGLTGDGTGMTQTFYIPAGATELYLGISDAGGYNGGPGSYNDNYDDFTVSYTETLPNRSSATPEPSSLVLLGTGLVGAFSAIRRRIRK